MDENSGLCLVQEEGAGALHMESFDHLPRPVRRLLLEAKCNFCPACFSSLLLNKGFYLEDNKDEAMKIAQGILRGFETAFLQQEDRKSA